MPRVATGSRFSLIYVRDLCDAILALLKDPGAGGTTLEIGDGCRKGYSWRRVAEVGGRHLGRRVTCISVPKSVMMSVANLSQISERLTGHPAAITRGKVRELFHDEWVCHDDSLAGRTGWRPGVGLDEGVGLTIKWYKDNGWL